MASELPVAQLKAQLFKALAHPVRIRALEQLVEGERSVGELAESIDTEISHLSQQLAVLRRAGVVDTRREGNTIFYSVSRCPDGWTAHDGAGDAGLQSSGIDSLAGPARGSERTASGNPVSGGFAPDAPCFGCSPVSADVLAAKRSPGRDLLAGLTVAIVALPLALAFGVASGLGAGAGHHHRGHRRRDRRRLRRQQPAGFRAHRRDDGRAAAGRARLRDGRGAAGRASWPG